MKYCSDDGKKVFDNEKDCLTYERKVEEENERKSKLEADKISRKHELDVAYKHYIDLFQAYNKDYGGRIYIGSCEPYASQTLDFFKYYGKLFK